VGALADVAVYEDKADRAAMFRAARQVFKNGIEVVRGGRVIGRHTGKAYTVGVPSEPAMARRLSAYTEDVYGIGAGMFEVPGHALGKADPFGAVACGR
jgi:formylmethanofuran dehydrogenase subunit A